MVIPGLWRPPSRPLRPTSIIPPPETYTNCSKIQHFNINNPPTRNLHLLFHILLHWKSSTPVWLMPILIGWSRSLNKAALTGLPNLGLSLLSRLSDLSPWVGSRRGSTYSAAYDAYCPHTIPSSPSSSTLSSFKASSLFYYSSDVRHQKSGYIKNVLSYLVGHESWCTWGQMSRGQEFKET